MKSDDSNFPSTPREEKDASRRADPPTTRASDRAVDPSPISPEVYVEATTPRSGTVESAHCLLCRCPNEESDTRSGRYLAHDVATCIQMLAGRIRILEHATGHQNEDCL
jgi:hypothetical protein